MIDIHHVVLLDLATGRERWAHALTDYSLYNGEAPQVVGEGDRLLLLTGLNIGYVLQRLDAATGKPLWPRPVYLRDARLDAAGWTLDDRAVYLVREGALEARALADGKHLWEQALGKGFRAGARLWRRGKYLLARSGGMEKVQFGFRWLFGRLQWEGGPGLNERGTFSVLCCDPDTGQVVQRLNFLPRLPRVPRQFRLAPELVLFPAFSLGRARGEDSWSVVQGGGPGLLVAFGGRAWGLGATGAKETRPAPH